MSELSRRVVLSSNIGALQLKVRFNFRKLATLLEAANLGGAALRAELIEAPGLEEGETEDAVAISEEPTYPKMDGDDCMHIDDPFATSLSAKRGVTSLPRLQKASHAASQADVYLLTSPRSRIGKETSEEPADLQRLYAKKRATTQQLQAQGSPTRPVMDEKASFSSASLTDSPFTLSSPEEIRIGSRRPRASTLETQMFTAKPSFSRSGTLRLSTLSRDALNSLKANSMHRQNGSPLRQQPSRSDFTEPLFSAVSAPPPPFSALSTPSKDDAPIRLTQPKDVESLGFVDRMQKMLLSEETYTVLRNVKTLLAAFEQGVEFSQAVLMSGAWRLKRFYDLVGTTRTRDIVTSMDEIEMARYFFKFALAAYGWKGLNFFGKRNAMMRDSARMNADKHAIRDFLQMKKEDMLIFEMNPGTVFCPCHFMVYDRSTNSIIIAIRGTMVFVLFLSCLQ